MSQQSTTTRRGFLKSSATGAAGMAVVTAGVSKSEAAVFAWPDKTNVHPAIDNLRVVVCHDEKMASKLWDYKNGQSGSWYVEAQNKYIDRDQVHANLDAMARELAQKSTASAAWKAIFRKSTSKEWASVKVAFKVNGIEPKNMTRLAVIEKIAIELNKLGVQYQNITIYDGCHNAKGKMDGFIGKGIPSGIKVSNKSDQLGGTVKAATPEPFKGSYSCTKHIADGTIDILVNMPVNKNHEDSRGGCTLSQKNHFGTFTPNPSGHGTHNYVLAINRSEAILGGDPPRQQLIVLDSIYAMTSGPTNNNFSTYVKNDRLVMGTFGPAVDYLVAKKIRNDIFSKSNSTNAKNAQEKWLDLYGYSATERAALLSKSPEQNNGKGWVTVAPADVTAQTHTVRSTTAGTTFELSIDGKHSQRISVNLGSARSAKSVTIVAANGKEIVTFAVSGTRASWDGKTASGRQVPAGSYVVNVRAGRSTKSAVLALR